MLSVLIGIAIPYRPGLPPKSRAYTVGVGSALALVDSSQSQVAGLGPNTANASGTSTLAYRASVLASVLASPLIVDDIARRVGISPDEIQVTPPAQIATATTAVTLPLPTSTKHTSGKNAYLLQISIPTLSAGQLPIIQVQTQAPTPSRAASFADASIAALAGDVNQVAVSEHVPLSGRLVVRQLGPAIASSSSVGFTAVHGMLGAVVVFLLACGVFLRLSSRRPATADEGGMGVARHPDVDKAGVLKINDLTSTSTVPTNLARPAPSDEGTGEGAQPRSRRIRVRPRPSQGATSESHQEPGFEERARR